LFLRMVAEHHEEAKRFQSSRQNKIGHRVASKRQPAPMKRWELTENGAFRGWFDWRNDAMAESDKLQGYVVVRNTKTGMVWKRETMSNAPVVLDDEQGFVQRRRD